MSIPPNGILKPEWELTPQEKEDAIKECVNHPTKEGRLFMARTFMLLYPYMADAIEKAAQKKLVEWLQAHSMAELVEPFGESIVIKFKDWQALCKELGVK